MNTSMETFITEMMNRDELNPMVKLIGGNRDRTV